MSKWPSWTLEEPGPVSPENPSKYLIDRIINHKNIGKTSTKYLMLWVGYGPEDDQWISGYELEDNKAGLTFGSVYRYLE